MVLSKRVLPTEAGPAGDKPYSIRTQSIWSLSATGYLFIGEGVDSRLLGVSKPFTTPGDGLIALIHGPRSTGGAGRRAGVAGPRSWVGRASGLAPPSVGQSAQSLSESL